MKNWVIFPVTVVILIFGMVIPVFANTNLAANPFFEEENGVMPGGWETMAFIQKPGVTEFKYEKTGGRLGGKFVTIVNHGPNDARFKQEISIKEYSLYRISCWVKTVNVDQNQKGANISIDSKMDTSADIKGTNSKWEYIEMYVKTGGDVSSMIITIGLGGYGSMTTGQASFDDVMVEEIGVPEGAVVVSLGNMETRKNETPPLDYASIGGPGTAVWALIIAAVIVAITGSLFYYWRIRKSGNHDVL